jgi:hypothetical protein
MISAKKRRTGPHSAGKESCRGHFQRFPFQVTVTNPLKYLELRAACSPPKNRGQAHLRRARSHAGVTLQPHAKQCFYTLPPFTPVFVHNMNILHSALKGTDLTVKSTTWSIINTIRKASISLGSEPLKKGGKFSFLITFESLTLRSIPAVLWHVYWRYSFGGMYLWSSYSDKPLPP